MGKTKSRSLVNKRQQAKNANAGAPEGKRQKVMDKEEEENQRTEFLMSLVRQAKSPQTTSPIKANVTVYEPETPSPVITVFEPKPSVTVYEPPCAQQSASLEDEGGEEEAPVEEPIEDAPAEVEVEAPKKGRKKRENKGGRKGWKRNQQEIPDVPEGADGEAQPKREEEPEENSDDDHENPLESFEKFCESLDTWMEPMNEAICAPSFSNLYEYVKEEYNTGRCYPPRYQIFNAYNLTPINNIKVVILGQDPYIQPKQAHGLCFSVCSKKRYVPKTLIELFRNLERNDEIDFKFPDPLHGDLTNWAKQGVFLLNSCLTTRKYQRGSHKYKGWEEFTKETIKIIDRQCKGIVYLLFGVFAQKLVKSIVNSDYNLVLCEKLPSFVVGQQFKNSKCFSQCNDYLKENGKEPVDWNIEQLDKIEKPEATEATE